MDLRVLRYFVAVAEERHFGRAAARLHMSQPPLSRAIRRLEDEFGVALLERTSHGVVLTEPGETLQRHARSLIEYADRIEQQVTAAAGAGRLVVGTGCDAVEKVGSGLVAAFRRRHPDVDVTLHETDLTEPTAGLRSGRVDVALTRVPFLDDSIRTHVLRSTPVAVVLRADDPLAHRRSVTDAELADRRWVRLPDGTDPLWCSQCTGGTRRPDYAGLPVMRTVRECLQSVLWSDTCSLIPLGDALPPGLVAVPITDRSPSRIVVAWRDGDRNPLTRSFVRIAAANSPAVVPRSVRPA